MIYPVRSVLTALALLAILAPEHARAQARGSRANPGLDRLPPVYVTDGLVEIEIENSRNHTVQLHLSDDTDLCGGRQWDLSIPPLGSVRTKSCYSSAAARVMIRAAFSGTDAHCLELRGHHQSGFLVTMDPQPYGCRRGFGGGPSPIEDDPGLCSTKVSIKDLGWSSGHKTEFCLERGFDGLIAAPGGHDKGGWCYSGNLDACRNAPAQSAPHLPEEPLHLHATCLCELPGGNIAAHFSTSPPSWRSIRPGDRVRLTGGSCTRIWPCSTNRAIPGPLTLSVEGSYRNTSLVYEFMVHGHLDR